MSETADLRDEVDALRERVRRLEQLLDQDDESPSENTSLALDHRDRAVLDELQERDGDPGPRATVGLYTRLTDITNQDTAVNRAKRLRRMDEFAEVVEG